MNQNHCLRSNGGARAWFESVEAAQSMIDTHPGYSEDVVVFCHRCGLFHCSHPTWLPSRPWENPIAKLVVN